MVPNNLKRLGKIYPNPRQLETQYVIPAKSHRGKFNFDLFTSF